MLLPSQSGWSNIFKFYEDAMDNLYGALEYSFTRL